MNRIYTGRFITMMTNEHPLWYWSRVHHPTNAMGPGIAKNPVPQAFRSKPQPTFVSGSFVNIEPEPLCIKAYWVIAPLPSSFSHLWSLTICLHTNPVTVSTFMCNSIPAIAPLVKLIQRLFFAAGCASLGRH